MLDQLDLRGQPDQQVLKEFRVQPDQLDLLVQLVQWALLVQLGLLELLVFRV